MSEKPFDLTPNYRGIFNGMLREAQALAAACWADGRASAETLRQIQRWFAPLTVAAQTATSAEDVQKLRCLMAEILADLDRAAAKLENAAQEEELTEAVM